MAKLSNNDRLFSNYKVNQQSDNGKWFPISNLFTIYQFLITIFGYICLGLTVFN